MTRHRPIVYVTKEPCAMCGRPGKIDNPLYNVCVACWCQAIHKDPATLIVKQSNEPSRR